MAITIQCPCGETYHAGEDDVGRRIRCRRCERMLDVTRPPGTKRRRRRRSATAGAGAWRPVLLPRTGIARLLAWAAWGYLATVCLIAAFMWTFGDVTIPGSVLLFMGRWVFLLPLALLVPAALLLDRHLLAPLALGALVVLGPVMGMRTGWRRLLPAPDGMPLRVVTFNVGRGDRLAQMLPEALRRWNADVVGFQECGELLTTAIRVAPGWHHYVGRDLCLLSRFPIRDTSVMDRSGLDRVKQSEGNLIGGAGYVVRVTIDGPRGPLRVTNLHLETPRKGMEGLMAGDLRRIRLNTEIRELESKLARAWADSGSGPSIVLGDFNTPVESRIFQRHWGDRSNAFSVAGTGLGMTKHNGWIRVRIDHVLVGPEWHVRSAAVDRELFSDHRPLVVDLTLRAR